MINPERAIILLEIDQKILDKGSILADNSPEKMYLLLSGLVVKQQGKLRVNNLIYAEVFNLSWVEQELGKVKLAINAQKLPQSPQPIQKQAQLPSIAAPLTGQSEEICAAFLENIDNLSLDQLEVIAQAIMQQKTKKTVEKSLVEFISFCRAAFCQCVTPKVVALDAFSADNSVVFSSANIKITAQSGKKFYRHINST